MHGSVSQWVTKTVEVYGIGGKTLDVGSLDVNGNMSHLFEDYTGLDMREGNNVDVVASAHSIPFEDNTFDTVMTLEMLEHDSKFWVSLPEMGRVLKPGGHFLLTTRGIGFPLHGYPSDFWRFTVPSGHILAELVGLEKVIDLSEDPQAGHSGIFLYGIKG